MKVDSEYCMGCVAGGFILAVCLAIRHGMLFLFHVDGGSESAANMVIWVVSGLGAIGLWFSFLILLVDWTSNTKKGPPTLTKRVTLNAQEAVDVTERDFGRNLDFSEESIKLIDELSSQMNKTWPNRMNKRNTRKLSLLWGCYLGEVLRGHSGGDWVEHKSKHGKFPALRKGTITINPVEKVSVRIANAREESLWDYYQFYKREFRQVYFKGDNSEDL